MPFGLIFKLIAKLCQFIFRSETLDYAKGLNQSAPLPLSFFSKIFRGKGWLCIPIYIASVAFTIPFFNTPRDGTVVRWDVLTAHFITGITCIYFATRFNRKTKKQNTENQTPFRTNDVFIFLSLKTWGILSLLFVCPGLFLPPNIHPLPTPTQINGNWNYHSKTKIENITAIHQGNIIFQSNDPKIKTYSDTGTLNITIKQSPKNKILKFNLIETGTWDQTKLILTLKNTNTQYTPANDSTKQFVSGRSDLKKLFQKPKMESTDFTITHFSESYMRTKSKKNDSSLIYRCTYEKQTSTKK